MKYIYIIRKLCILLSAGLFTFCVRKFVVHMCCAYIKMDIYIYWYVLIYICLSFFRKHYAKTIDILQWNLKWDRQVYLLVLLGSKKILSDCVHMKMKMKSRMFISNSFDFRIKELSLTSKLLGSKGMRPFVKTLIAFP